MLAAQSAIVSPDWDFREMMIGGLHKVLLASSSGSLQHLMSAVCMLKCAESTVLSDPTMPFRNFLTFFGEPLHHVFFLQELLKSWVRKMITFPSEHFL